MSDRDEPVPPPLVDWAGTAVRIRRSAALATAAGLIGWSISRALGGPGIGTFIGLVVAVIFVSEVVIVGGSALRGMLRAGERGERLAGSDVALLPPRLRRPRGRP